MDLNQNISFSVESASLWLCIYHSVEFHLCNLCVGQWEFKFMCLEALQLEQFSASAPIGEGEDLDKALIFSVLEF